VPDQSNTPSKTALGYSPFHVAAADYLAAGYLPIPLPLAKKGPPPSGTPNELTVDATQVDEWLEGKYHKKDCTKYINHSDKNIGSIVPDECVVLDVDGAAARETLIEMEGTYGALPRTWMSFRGNPDRYHMWFRTPAGLTWPGRLAAGIDVIYRHYRYMVMPPSVHPDGGQYRWANLNGSKLKSTRGYFPSIDEFTELPQEWLVLADSDGYKYRERANVDSRLWIAEHGAGKPCAEMRRVVVLHQKLIRKHADLGGMHDAMNNAVWSVVAEILNGHTGGYMALKRIKNCFMTQAEDSGRRLDGAAETEWMRACVGAIEKTAVERVRQGDPCVVEESERGQDTSRFFDPKHGIKTISLRRAVERTGKLAVGPGKLIYRHTDGMWVPDGESEVYRRTASLLRQRWRPTHAALVKSIVEHREPLISDDNQDVKYLNLPNGLLDWEEGVLYPHNSAVVSTIRLPIVWDEDAECPTIDKFFSEVFPSDALELAYEILGYMLYNDNPLHKAILLYGSGRNGKGTYLRLARMLAGHNNISAVTPQDLDASAFSSAQLYGKLANLVGDVDPRIFRSTEKFKQLTGGDHLMGQHKHKDPFVFMCRALMIAAFNALPRTADTTEGFFSRWVVVPFTAFFPAGKADTSLVERLTRPEELQGLLRASVAGLQQVMRRGQFSLPASVVAATERFKMEADPMRGFIEERITSCQPNNSPVVPRTEVYLAYTMWAQLNGFHPMSAHRFYESFMAALTDVVEYPVRAITVHGTQAFRGISIT
jgi:P4 family phage/plasmid primase-like protien